MRKTILSVLILSFMVFAFFACADKADSSSPLDGMDSMDSATDVQSETVVETCSIFYVGIKTYQKQEMQIPDAMMPVTGNYPTSYIVGEAVHIDDLAYLWTPQAEYEFIGYYSDPACEVAFNGITETTTGNVTVYALIQVSYNLENV